MIPDPVDAPASIDWGWAGLGFAGGESGDQHLVMMLPHGALLAVIDGLGHGPKAALAAREAVSILQMHATLPIPALIARCHEGLKHTRGAVMSLAVLDNRSGTLDWCGVGNVEGVLLRAETASGRTCAAIIARGGVVGYRLPSLRVNTVSLLARDILILATDGISSDFTHAVDLEQPPQAIADSVFVQCSKASDDALVLVARYLGTVA
jgi:phosphoserine phosphatase RsbX